MLVCSPLAVTAGCQIDDGSGAASGPAVAPRSAADPARNSAGVLAGAGRDGGARDAGDAAEGATAGSDASGDEADQDAAADLPASSALIEAYDRSVAAECACLWSSPGYGYDSEAACVAVASLGETQRACMRAQLRDADPDALACKLGVEDDLQACLDDCAQAHALGCVERWADDDEACDPVLAARLYDRCLAPELRNAD